MIEPIQPADAVHEMRAGLTDSDKAAAELFARLLLKEVRKSMPEGIGGPSMDAFGDVFDGELARRIVESGQFSLSGRGKVQAPPASPSVPFRPRPRSTGVDVGRITSAYGMRADPIHGGQRAHSGVDVAAPPGTSIRAARAGTVSFSGERGGYGNLVVIDHGNGLQTRYAHCRDLEVSAGDRVAAGEMIASVGSTGRATGPHVHFEVRRDGSAVDPQTLGDPTKILNSTPE